MIPTAIVGALEDAGYRLTSPRRAVAEMIGSRRDHFTADELLSESRRRRLGVTRATVFRSLDVLADLGLIERLDLPSGEHAFVACEPAHHHHLVCSSCGRSTEVDDNGLEGVAAAIARQIGLSGRYPPSRAVRALPGVPGARLSMWIASFLPFFSTLAGGYAALRLRHRLHALMAVAAGVVVATAIADLLPEAFELVGQGGALQVGIAAVCGFIGFSFLEAFLHQSSFEHGGAPGHDHSEDHDHVGAISPTPVANRARQGTGIIGLLPPISLVIHSAMDGLMIGFAFQAGDDVGLIVLLAVLAPRLRRRDERRSRSRWTPRGEPDSPIAFVFIDAAAAPVGGFLSSLISIDDNDARPPARDLRRRLPGGRRGPPAARIAASRPPSWAADGRPRGSRRRVRTADPGHRARIGLVRGGAPMHAPSGLGPIMQILVPVSDVEKATEFYERVLELPLLYKYPGNAFFNADGVRLYLAQPSEADFDGRASIYFQVEDVTGTFERLVAAGAAVREEPEIVHRDDAYDLWLAFVQDLDGNNIGLMREAPKGLERG